MRKKARQKHIVFDISKREIWLSGEIVKRTPKLIKTAIFKISKNYRAAPINLFISSIGGNVIFAKQIYWIINHSETPIHTVAVDYAVSGGFFIMQAGKRRFAFPKAYMQFHQAENHPKDFKKMAKCNADYLGTNVEYLKDTDAVQKFVFTSRSRSINEILELFSKDAAVSAVKAKKLHLIDEIMKPRRKPK